ncbi:hypothetical protein [Lutibacter sp.]
MDEYIMYVILMFFLGIGFNLDEEYEIAYNYIKQDSIKTIFIYGDKQSIKNEIFVADTLVFIETTFFLDEILSFKYSGLNKVKMQNLLNEEYLKQIEKGKKFKGHKLKELNKFNKNKSGDFILYFSPIENGILMAELFKFPRSKNKINIKDLRHFNRSIQYLFYFNDAKKLLKIYKRKIHYN